MHINTFINRNPGTETFRTQDFWSETTPFSYTGKPVFVLTSGRTFSGGEEFAYDMQVMKLANVVGDTTGGGANPGGTVRLAAGLTMFIPGGRARNPITSIPRVRARRSAPVDADISASELHLDAYQLVLWTK